LNGNILFLISTNALAAVRH